MTSHDNQLTTDCLYMAMELSMGTWKLAFARQRGQKPRRRDVVARDRTGLEREISLAKRKFGLPENAPVVSCYEAGRDGFWIHRYLGSQGVQNVVVDSSSIEVNRRQRRVKNDRLDAEKLLAMLIRWREGEVHVWSTLQIPSESDEDARRLHRELQSLKEEHTRHNNRIKSLLIGIGIELDKIERDLPQRLQQMRQWHDEALPVRLHAQVLREFRRLQLVNEQIRELEKQRAEAVRHAEDDPQVEKVRRLMEVCGIGINSSWMFVKELYGWRKFRNRREVGAVFGLAPTPYNSGNSEREQGISKAGNRRLRSMAIEIAWGWLRFQPRSRLTQWYLQRFAKGSKRQRRIGIVALARKLMILLWRYVEHGEVTDGFDTRDTPTVFSYTIRLS